MLPELPSCRVCLCINIYAVTQNYLLYLHLKLLVYALEIVCVIDTHSDAHTHTHTLTHADWRQVNCETSCTSRRELAQLQLQHEPNNGPTKFLSVCIFETLIIWNVAGRRQRKMHETARGSGAPTHTELIVNVLKWNLNFSQHIHNFVGLCSPRSILLL